jgi:hypothetical protein
MGPFGPHIYELIVGGGPKSKPRESKEWALCREEDEEDEHAGR